MQALRHSHTTYHNHQGGSSHQKEKPRLLEPKKQSSAAVANFSLFVFHFFSEAKRNGVFPMMMFIVAKQRVMVAWIVQELALKHKGMTAAHSSESWNISRGVFSVFVKLKELLNY